MHDYWLKQGNEPLFPDLVWSKPENKQYAGKLLIIGGNSFGMNAPAEAFRSAVEAGVGVAKVLLPDSLHRSLGNSLEHVEFAPSNKSGGFSKKALAEWLDYANWADAIMLAGDTARNSETAMVMEEFTRVYKGKLSVTQDCLDQFISNPKYLFNRPDTLIVASFAQLQKAWAKITTIQPIQYNMSLSLVVDTLHNLTQILPISIITKHNDQIIVATNARVSTTHNQDDIWRVKTCADASVWWLQNPAKHFEALTNSLI